MRLALCTLVAFLALCAPALARDDSVRSSDGTKIVLSYFPAEGLQPGQRAPTVLVGHGWGQTRDTDPNSTTDELFGSIGLGPLRRAGYNVLTWDARGFGSSGGTVEVDSPQYEARDVQALIDYVARQPESQLDGPGDPLLGMAGASYGGGIQWATAGIDRRVDVIEPDISWHSLISALFKDGASKYGWGNILFGLGTASAGAEGLPGGETGSLDPHITSAYQGSLVNGTPSQEDQAFFAARGPGDEGIGRIRIPTLITQGTADTLFTLQESIQNYAILRRNRVPTKMLWFCGGHGACTTNAGPGGHLEKAMIDWFNRYLKGNRSVRTGPRFEWVGDDGVWRSGPDYPMADGGSISGEGGGTLPLGPDYSSGTAIAATPAAVAVNVPIQAPAHDAEVVGTPRLEMDYSGTSQTSSTIVYAQIVDNGKNLALGNQVTPVPVVLDGSRHTLSIPLEPVAVHATPSSSYKLQIINASQVYGLQRAAGTLDVARARITLPIADPSGTPPGYPASARARARHVRLLRLARPHRRARNVRRVLRVRTSATRRLSGIVLTLRGRHGALLGRSRPATFRGRRPVGIVLRRHLRPGRYSVSARGRAADARVARARIRFRLR